MALNLLTSEHAAVVASAYAAGRPTGEMRPVARGELGRIWRLRTSDGDLAIKELFHAPTEADATADVAFQLLALEAGVLLPEPILRPDGRVLLDLEDGPTVRAYRWMDLSPVDTRPVGKVAGVLAVLHRLGDTTTDTPNPWYTDPVGEPAWQDLIDAAEAHDAPFAAGLRRALPELLELERMLPVGALVTARRCHLDLDDSNLAWDQDGRLVVLDWENSGPAEPAHDLAMLVADYGLEDGRRLVESYAAAGGPATIGDVDDFAMAAAVQGHLIQFYARRWLERGDPEGVERSRWRLEAALGDGMLTPASIDALVTARSEARD